MFAPEKVVEVEKIIVAEKETGVTEFEDQDNNVTSAVNVNSYQDNNIGISFELASDWIQVSVDETEEDKLLDTHVVAFESPNLHPHVVNAGMGGLPTEGIENGARLLIVSEPANIADSINTPQSYVDFVSERSNNSSNSSQVRDITVFGIPAAYAEYRDVEQVYGGWVKTEFLHDGRIISITLRYGVDESFFKYEELYSSILDSVQIIAEDEYSIPSTVYSEHPTVGSEAYISGPETVVAGEEYVWTLVVPPRLLPTLPEVMWGDGTKDGCDLGCSGQAWYFNAEGVTEMKHTYEESGEYAITVYMNGSGEDYKQGTVVLNKSVRVE